MFSGLDALSAVDAVARGQPGQRDQRGDKEYSFHDDAPLSGISQVFGVRRVIAAFSISQTSGREH
jgi:hypothetical protein